MHKEERMLNLVQDCRKELESFKSFIKQTEYSINITKRVLMKRRNRSYQTSVQKNMNRAYATFPLHTQYNRDIKQSRSNPAARAMLQAVPDIAQEEIINTARDHVFNIWTNALIFIDAKEKAKNFTIADLMQVKNIISNLLRYMGELFGPNKEEVLSKMIYLHKTIFRLASLESEIHTSLMTKQKQRIADVMKCCQWELKNDFRDLVELTEKATIAAKEVLIKETNEHNCEDVHKRFNRMLIDLSPEERDFYMNKIFSCESPFEAFQNALLDLMPDKVIDKACDQMLAVWEKALIAIDNVTTKGTEVTQSDLQKMQDVEQEFKQSIENLFGNNKELALQQTTYLQGTIDKICNLILSTSKFLEQTNTFGYVVQDSRVFLR